MPKRHMLIAPTSHRLIFKNEIVVLTLVHNTIVITKAFVFNFQSSQAAHDYIKEKIDLILFYKFESPKKTLEKISWAALEKKLCFQQKHK